MNEKNGETAVYKSEVSNHKEFKPFEIPVSLFCNADFVRPLSL